MSSNDGIDITPADEDFHWWETEEPHSQVLNTLAVLSGETDQRNRKFRRFISTYLNKDCAGWGPGAEITESQTWRNDLLGEKFLFLNPARNVAETLGARISTQKITPTFLTSISDPKAYKLQRQAKLLQKAVEAEWYSAKLYRIARRVFNDASVLGFGVMAVFVKDDKVCFERVFPGNIIVPERDYLTSELPRTLYQKAYVSAQVLLAQYPKKEDAIKLAIGNFTSESSVTDLVEVTEAWHLKSGPKAKDGKHACIIEGATLFDEEYSRDHFPFAFFKWSDPVLGFYPQGVMEQTEPLQKELNKLLKRLQRAVHLYSVAKTYAPKGTVNEDMLRNVSGDLVEYEGNVPPKELMPNAISSEVFRLLSLLRGWIFEDQGVSQMSATSVKPPGVESGRALMHLGEMETGRHAQLSTSWEDMFCDVADLTVECCHDIPNHKSRFRTSAGFEEIDWGIIDKGLSYELKVFPTSYLPITPTGRLETVQQLLDAGLITDEQEARKLLAFPDLEQSDSLATAAIDDVDRQVDKMLSGEEQSPEPYMVMQQGIIDRVSAALFRAKQFHYPEDELGYMQAWIDEAQAMLEEEVAKRQQQIEIMQMAEQAPAGAAEAVPPALPVEVPPEILPPTPEMGV